MIYENPPIPEGINVSREHPLKEFFQLTIGLALVTALAVAALAYGMGFLARSIPFSVEQRLAKPYLGPLQEQSEIEAYLQQLADRLTAVHPLPPGMTVSVHYLDSDTTNAMATLGGQIIVFRGLLQEMPHENALAMVMAHEIGHIRHRDPIVGLGRGVVIGVALATLAGMSGNDIVGNALGSTGIMTLLKFTRDQERDADADAVVAVAALYGHTGGADAFFRTLLLPAAEVPGVAAPQFLSTHPLTETRVHAINEHAASAGYNTTGATTQLPEPIHALIGVEDSATATDSD